MTLLIAIVGAVTGVASLAWQIISSRLDRGRLSVELCAGWLTDQGAVTAPLNGAAEVTLSRDSEALLVVTATNVGRSPVSLASWAVEIGPTSLSGRNDLGVNPSLPVRLEGHERAHFVVRAADVVGLGGAIRQGHAPKGALAVDMVRASVSPTVGKRVVSEAFELQLVEDFLRSNRRA